MKSGGQRAAPGHMRAGTDRLMGKNFSWIGGMVVCLAMQAACAPVDGLKPLSSNARFQMAVAEADRIVIRDGGFDCCQPVEGQKTRIIIRNPGVVAEFKKNLTFRESTAGQSMFVCLCCGYPGIDWYKGTNRLALTAVHHGRDLAWAGFDQKRGVLTEEASIWLTDWLAAHNEHGWFDEYVELKNRRMKPSE